jgi:hypothetical protein
MNSMDITSWQRLIPYHPAIPRRLDDYRYCARWWSLEAKRPGNPCPQDCERYARNMRLASGLAGQFGPGTWTELHDRLRAHAEAARKRKAEHLAIVRDRKRAAERLQEQTP